MDLISAVRSQPPLQQSSQHRLVDRQVKVSAADTRPVTDSLRHDVVPTTSGLAPQVSVQLVERPERQHPAAEARAAAMAAREAYIKASIAAGMSPLPMP